MNDAHLLTGPDTQAAPRTGPRPHSRPDVLAHLRRTDASTYRERRRLLSSGRAIAIDRGHIAVGVPETGIETWERADLLDRLRLHAVQGNLPEAVATRTAAALARGLWTAGHLARIDIGTSRHAGRSIRTLPGPDGSPGRGLSVHRQHRPDMRPEEIATVDGLRVTTLRRTVVDCLLHEKASVSLLAAVSAARHDGGVANRWHASGLQRAREFLSGVREDLLRLPPSRPGRRRALVVLASADPLLESAGEAMCLVFARAIGLPQPQIQTQFRVNGATYYGDLWWDLFGLLLEFDGLTKYGAAAPLIAEKTREDDLRSLPGIRSIQRVTWPILRQPRRRWALERALLTAVPVDARPALTPCRDFGVVR